MKKRIFAILLALVMLLGALPVTAMAADDVSKVVKSAFTTWDTYKRALVLTNNIAEPVYATVVVKPGETITDFGNLVFFTTGGHALSSGFSNTLRWNYTPDVVDLNVVEDGGTLRVSFTGKQEGTAKVKLNYWTSYYFPDSQTGSGVTAHCSGDIYYNLIVSNDPVDLNTKPEKPGKDVLDTVHGNNDGYAVKLNCIDLTTTAHDFFFKTLASIYVTDGYVVSDVFPNNGTYDSAASDTDKYPWACQVTVYGQPYLDYYNATQGKGQHYIYGNTGGWYFYLYYNAMTGRWAYIPGLFPLTFNITTQKQSMEDITLSYDGGTHDEDHVSNIPAAETKHVRTIAGAKFTVSSTLPTCGCGKDCTFLGWMLDGDSKLYVGGDAIELSASATLHAQWREGSGGDNNPEKPVGPGESESDSGNIDFGDNKITVDCVKNSGHTSLTLPLSKDTIVKNSGTMGTAAGTGSIRIATNYYVNEYVDNAASGRMPHKAKQNEATIPLKWDATKWIVDTEAGIPTIEVECVTTVTPEELAALDIEVNVDCVDENGEDTKAYAVVKDDIENIVILPADDPTAEDPQLARVTFEIKTAGFVAKYNAEGGYNPNHTQVWPLNGGNLKWVAYFNNGVLNDCSGLIEDTHRNDTIEVTHTSVTPPLDKLNVTFDYQTIEFQRETVLVNSGETVTAPDMTNKTRTGYIFGGWYTDSACTDGKEFKFSTPITESMTLYAKWTPKQVPYTIRHRDKDTNETVAPDTTGTGAYGEKITLTPKTDIADYVPAEGNPQYSWLMSEVGNIFTLRYVKLFTVSFDCHMDGMTIAAKTVQRNAKVTSPGTLTRAGYAFGGWYKNLSDAAAYDFDTPVTESFTLHAKWTPRADIPYTVKYLEEGTNRELHAAKTGTGTFNTTVQVTAEAISGYTLVGSSPRGLELENVSSNELIFYYTKDPVKVSYTVHYYEQGTTTKVAADKVVNNVNAGTEVTEDAISVTGYTAAAPTQQKLNLSATGTNEIIFYYTKNAGTQVGYTIRYLKEGTGEALLPAYSGTGVAGNSLTVTAPAIDGYTCVSANPQTITLNAEAAENIITFYYREATSTIPAGEPAKEPFNKNANPRQLNRDDHFAYIKGYPDGTVRPEASLTRAEAAAILYRVMEKSCVERFHAESSSFRDVPDGKWYTTYVATLEKAGVIVDSKDGNFRPNEAITRAELASMLAQFANVTGGTNTFSDVPATHWAADYIAAAVRSGWIQGYPDGTFRPEQTIKRAEMTAMVNRALGRDPQSASDLLEGMKTWKDNADPTAWFYLDIQEAANGHTYARKTGGEYWTGLVADVVQ